jgi:8-oxo-dGTP diphosphatase
MKIQSRLAKLWQGLRLPTKLQLWLMRRFNDQFLIGVTGIIFNRQGQVLLFKHAYRDNGRWSLPGGYVKAGEHPREGLEREITEESGLTVSVDYRLKLRTDRDSPRVDLTYAGTYIGGEFRPSSEVETVDWFDPAELPQLPADQVFFIDRAVEVKKQGDGSADSGAGEDVDRIVDVA